MIRFFPHSPRALLLLASWICAWSATAAAPTVRVLILSGQNNHDWHQTTAALQGILAASDRFTVEVTEHPETCDAATFSRFDALLSNWNSFGDKVAVKEWPAATRDAFLSFIRRGGGLVVVHAGASSFNDWTDYQAVAGGWWGTNTGHGPIHSFAVKMADPEHPITRGVAPFQTTDELWHRMATPAEKQVLATAFSAQDKGGSGADEPVALVTQFGRGRGFDLVLGHDARAMSFAGFRTLLLRGTEWAATGKVTLPPDAGGVTGTEMDAALNTAARYHYGETREPLAAVEKLVAAVASQPERQRMVAEKLAARLAAESTVEARQFFCAQLSLVGSAAQVPALAALLTDTNLGYYARQALERLPGDESTEALRSALGQLTGSARLGIINSLAARPSEKAVDDLAKLLEGTDEETVTAALRALGAVGNPEAARALRASESKLAPALKTRLAEAQLVCAQHLAARGRSGDALEICGRLSGPDQPDAIRFPAFALYTSGFPDGGQAQVLAGLKSREPAARAAALYALRQSRQPGLLPIAATHLAELAPDSQVQLIGLLAERSCGAARNEVVQALDSPEPNVRAAALAGLPALGNASTIPALVSRLASTEASQRRALIDCLARLPDPEVDRMLAGSVMVAPANSATPLPAATRAALLHALVVRGDRAIALPVLTKAVASPEAEVRREAIAGLGAMGDAASSALLLPLLDHPGSDAPALESALADICRRSGGPEPVLPALAEAPSPKKLSLLNILAALGGRRSLEVLRGELKAADGEVAAAALRILTDWPDASPWDDLAAFALAAPEGRAKTLALRGVIKLAPQAKDRPIEERVQWLTRLLPAAGLQERKALLGALAELPSVSALQAATTLLTSPELADESALAILNLVDQIGHEHSAEARKALDALQASSQKTELVAQAKAARLRLGQAQNLSRGATATNPDGLAADGQAGGPQAAIDGDPNTYWDEVDNQKLYILRVQLKAKSKVLFLRILGWKQHEFAPKDFEVVCDGQPVRKVAGAQYRNNWLTVDVPPTECSVVELRITGYYGGSPAIRELEIYGTGP